jgi:DNA-binding HxlR family transcriptional regulator
MKLCVIIISLHRKFVSVLNNDKMKKKVPETHSGCSKEFMAIKDAMDILSGKWKIHIIGTLTYSKGAVRFMDLLRLVDGIGAKMLSKELHDLEVNLLIKRTVLNTKPITVEYELTPHGKTLEKAINELRLWGALHRKKIIEKK